MGRREGEYFFTAVRTGSSGKTSYGCYPVPFANGSVMFLSHIGHRALSRPGLRWTQSHRIDRAQSPSSFTLTTHRNRQGQARQLNQALCFPSRYRPTLIVADIADHSNPRLRRSEPNVLAQQRPLRPTSTPRGWAGVAAASELADDHADPGRRSGPRPQAQANIDSARAWGWRAHPSWRGGRWQSFEQWHAGA